MLVIVIVVSSSNGSISKVIVIVRALLIINILIYVGGNCGEERLASRYRRVFGVTSPGYARVAALVYASLKYS